MIGRAQIAAEPCPMGGPHRLTSPVLWIGTSCWRCHRTWEGTGLVPTYPDDPSPTRASPAGETVQAQDEPLQSPTGKGG